MDFLGQVFDINLGNLVYNFDTSRSSLLPGQVQHQLYQQPDIQIAKTYKLQHSVCNLSQGAPKPLPIWSTSTKDLGRFSIGLELYFLFLKQMIFIFFMISIISCFPLYQNYTGGFLDRGEYSEYLNSATIANQSGPQLTTYQNPLLGLQQARDQMDEIQENYFQIWISNAAYTILIILLIQCFQYQGTLRIRRSIIKHYTITDYSVQVKNLPRGLITKAEIMNHFQRFGQISEVFLARKYYDQLFNYTARAQCQKQAIKQVSILNYHNKNPQLDRRYKKIMKLIEKFDNKILENSKAKPHEELPVIRAYIVFNDPLDKSKCLKTYNKCFRYYCQPKYLRFKGKRIKVKQAPEPENILYQNLEIGAFSRRCRKVFSLISLSIIMLFSIGLLYYVKTYDQGLPSKEECLQRRNDYQDIDIQRAKLELQQDQDEFCWCKAQSLNDLIQDSDINDYCSTYLTKQSRSISLKYGSAFGIFMINFILKLVIRALIKFQRNSNYNKQQKKIMIRVFIALFINTGLITLAVNADFSDFPLASEYLFEGEFKDFTRDWYTKVGLIFQAISLVSIFSPHMIILLILHPLRAMKRACFWKNYKNQYELNKSMIGGNFDVSTRSAQILMVVFVCFLYSGGIPFMNMICFTAMLIIYWTDKYLMVRYYTRPPIINQSFYLTSVKFLYFAVIFHCLFSIYMYGCPQIFPTEYYMGGSQNNELNVEEEDYQERLGRDAGIVFILIIALALVMLSFTWLVLKICKKCTKQLKIDIGQRQKEMFYQIKNKLKTTGMNSYNIYKNPKYALLVDAMDKACGVKENFDEQFFKTRLKEESRLKFSSKFDIENDRSRIELHLEDVKSKGNIMDETTRRERYE